MDTEITTSHKNKKKFLIIALAVVLVSVIAVGYRYYQRVSVTPETFEALPPRELTETEKLLKTQNEELDRLRTQHQGQGAPPSNTTLQNQFGSIDILRKQVLRQKTTATSVSKIAEQQTQELDALRAAANK